MLGPYLSTSKRVFGQYFYNVNSTFYMWYDDWPHASVGTMTSCGDPMPTIGMLSASDRTKILDWIASGASD